MTSATNIKVIVSFSTIIFTSACYDFSLKPRDAGPDGGAGISGAGSAGGSGGIGGTIGIEAGASDDAVAVPPPASQINTGFLTLGGRRSDGTITLYDDAFEIGERLCTADGKFCVTGGLTP